MIHIRSTGIVRRLDRLGRVVLPMEVRRIRQFEENDPIEIFTEGEFVILKKYIPHCVFCDEKLGKAFINGKPICSDCIDYFKQAGK